jgi:hypothetical protein
VAQLYRMTAKSNKEKVKPTSDDEWKADEELMQYDFQEVGD